MGIVQNIKVNKNLKMAIGQLEGILKMIFAKRDSVEISDQLNATQALIKSCQLAILKDDITQQIEDIVTTSNQTERNAKTDKLILYIDRMIK